MPATFGVGSCSPINDVHDLHHPASTQAANPLSFDEVSKEVLTSALVESAEYSEP